MILSPDDVLASDGPYLWTQERVSFAWATVLGRASSLLASPEVRKLVLLVGLPGAGKTTWLRSHEEPDVLYVDATFTKRSERARLLELSASACKPCGVVLFTTPYDLCASRNALRPPGRSVPIEKMEKLHSQLSGTPPDLSEGFSDILLVSGT